jgi:hypothetical protein
MSKLSDLFSNATELFLGTPEERAKRKKERDRRIQTSQRNRATAEVHRAERRLKELKYCKAHLNGKSGAALQRAQAQDQRKISKAQKRADKARSNWRKVNPSAE